MYKKIFKAYTIWNYIVCISLAFIIQKRNKKESVGNSE